MKKFTYIFFMLFAVVFSACNSEDFDYDIEYTPIHPIGGQYRVSIVDETGAEVKLSSSMYCYPTTPKWDTVPRLSASTL